MPFTKQQKLDTKSLIEECFNDSKFVDALADKVANIVSDKMKNLLEALNNQVKHLENKLLDTTAENEELRRRVDDLEQNNKLDSIRIYGVPETNNKGKLQDQVISILDQYLGVPKLDIVSCYRLGPKNNKIKSRPILLKFSTIAQRNEIYYNKKKLKGSKVVIVEDLTKARHDLFNWVKEKVGRQNAWTKNGKIHAKIKDRNYFINTAEDLQKFMDQE